MSTPQLHLPDLDEVAIGDDPVAKAAPPPAPPPPRRLLPRLMGLALTWLPLIVLTLAAAFTWWLAKRTPAPTTATERVARHEPDYTLARFTIDRFDAEGRHAATLSGEALRHYPDTDTIEIDRLGLDARLPDERPLTAQASLGLIAPGRDEVQLQGAAEVRGQTPDGTPLVLRGEQFTAWTDSHRVHTDAPVRVDWGASRLDAGGLDWNAAEQTLHLAGPAQGRFVRRAP